MASPFFTKNNNKTGVPVDIAPWKPASVRLFPKFQNMSKKVPSFENAKKDQEGEDRQEKSFDFERKLSDDCNNFTAQ